MIYTFEIHQEMVNYSCYPELKDRFVSITFGAPPAMDEKTASGISSRIYSFINGNDPVSCMSFGNIKRFGKEILLALLTIFSSELDSKIMAFSMRGCFDVIHTEGFEKDEPNRPIGKVYHMTWELWKDAGINCVFPHHSLGMYGRQFKAYKNGVLKPMDFDKDAVAKDIKSNSIKFDIL